MYKKVFLPRNLIDLCKVQNCNYQFIIDFNIQLFNWSVLSWNGTNDFQFFSACFLKFLHLYLWFYCITVHPTVDPCFLTCFTCLFKCSFIFLPIISLLSLIIFLSLFVKIAMIIIIWKIQPYYKDTLEFLPLHSLRWVVDFNFVKDDESFIWIN